MGESGKGSCSFAGVFCFFWRCCSFYYRYRFLFRLSLVDNFVMLVFVSELVWHSFVKVDEVIPSPYPYSIFPCSLVTNHVSSSKAYIGRFGMYPRVGFDFMGAILVSPTCKPFFAVCSM